MKSIWLAFLVVVVVLLIIMMFAGPCLTMNGSLASSKASALSASRAASQNWAVTSCNEAVLYSTLANAQKAVQRNQYISDRGTKFVVCNVTSAALPDCPTCPACPSCPGCAACPACNCPSAKDCPACNCPASKDCPAIPPCPPQRDCPACNCPEQNACPACTSSCNCPVCPAQKDCPDLKCPDAVPCPACPTLQPQPIEFVVQGNVSKV